MSNKLEPASKLKLAYVTSNTLKESSGGVSAVSYNAFRKLSRHFDVQFNGHIKLQHDLVPQWTSKIRRRILKLPGNFDFYSKKRLSSNASVVKKMINSDVEVVFFKGCTPWIKYSPVVPYFAYIDVCFHTYFFNTFRLQDFIQFELDRIWNLESSWLKNATSVFFESDWGLKKAIEAYQLEGSNFLCVGRGGNIPVPGKDVYDNRNMIMVSIARNFKQKGGDIIFDAYLELLQFYPKLQWHIIGEKPDRQWERFEGIRCYGFLDKNSPKDLSAMQSVLEQAFVLVHPTREDTNPLVISEAGYFGCPSISVDRFAIPELIRNGENGILLDYPVETGKLVEAVKSLVENPGRYKRMRRQAREYALQTANWDKVGDRIAQHIIDTLQ
jgi:glycosyltransferase involved in cell wall biosynthesis